MEILEGAPPEDAPQRRTRAQRNVAPLVVGQAVSLFGDFVAFFTIPFFVYDLTGRPGDLGLAAAAETLPMLLFGFAAGVLLDRLRRLSGALVLVDLARAAVFSLLALAAATDVATPWMVFAVAFAAGSLAVVFDSGLQAFMPLAVEDAMLVRVNAHLALSRTVAMSAGPLVAGFTVAVTGGFALALWLDAASFVVSAAALLVIRPIRPRERAREAPFASALRQGLRFLFAEAHLRWATIGAFITNLVFAPLEALLIVLVSTRILGLTVDAGTGAGGHGSVLGTFYALQALVASVFVFLAPRVSRRMALGTMYAIGAGLFGAGFLVVSFVPGFWAVIPAGIGLGAVAWLNVAIATLRQRLTPQPIRGRVIAASRTLGWAGLPLGAAVGGQLAEIVGIVPLYVVAGAVVVGVGIGVTFTPLVRDPVPAIPD